jgi:1-aminocyclopropane-1-carboxylate deaminase/D-cysteine desulfhydrase-like pyridoxal-dependent ACC family enzyme
MVLLSHLQTPVLQKIHHPVFDQAGISVMVKRDDQIHPVVSGNKLYKLSGHLQQFTQSQSQTLVTFGGAYSNHLHATAYACKENGISCVAIIRGEQILPLNPTLKDCVDNGMILEPVSRKEYGLGMESEVVQEVIDRYPSAYVVPEGGGGELGVVGAQEILSGVDQSQFDVIVAACGTGTTLAGIINAAEPHVQVVGIPVLKGADKWMPQEIDQYLTNKSKNWELLCDYHFGGYAKHTEEVLEFIKWAEVECQLPLDQVYTGKAFYGLVDRVKSGYWKAGTRILFIHTGGLQGRRSL